MAGTYTHLNFSALAKVFQPQQNLNIIINTVSQNEEGNTEKISIVFDALITELRKDHIVLQLDIKDPDNWLLFHDGRIITVEVGNAEGAFTFKSKVVAKSEVIGMLIIDGPKVLAGKERRRGPRVQLNVPVLFSIAGLGQKKIEHLQGKVGVGISTQLAEGGLTFTTELKLPVGMVVVTEFIVNEKKISVAGCVQRCIATDQTDRHFIVGIKFLTPIAATQRLIRQIVRNPNAVPQNSLSLRY